MKRSLFSFDAPYQQFELLELEGEGTSPNRRPNLQREIPTHLSSVREYLNACFCTERNRDLILPPFRIGGRIDALSAFLNGMADGEQINDFLLRSAQCASLPHWPVRAPEKLLIESVFPMQETELVDDFSAAICAITEGRTAVFLAGRDKCILFDTRGYESRTVGKPKNEPTVLGPHEAFTENVRTNITLLRRILKLPQFVVSFEKLCGAYGTQIGICYLDGVTNPALLDEVRKRLLRIAADCPLSIGQIEQAIEEYSWLPLPQTLKTERPDRAAAAIADGKVVLLLDGSPIACVLPVTLGMLFASAEDASARRPVGTLVRIVRAMGLLLSILLPAYFLALTQHHIGQLSGEVLSVVLSSHVMVFLPLPAEMIFLLLIFQLVREAGIRVPGVVGHAIGIIGGLLLGQAAVAAHLVSTVVLIIVALSGLGNFTIPDYSTQVCVAYYRIALCIAAALGGFVGIGSVALLTLAMLCTVKSFGVPMLAPFAPAAKPVRPFLVRGNIRSRVPQDILNAESSL